MKKYIGKRLLQLLPVLLGVTFLSFAMMRAAGSDAITELYGDKGAVAQEIIDAKRAELGLDQPFLVQYGAWLRGLLTGDMGVSYVSGKKVFDTFVSKLPATLLLTNQNYTILQSVAFALGSGLGYVFAVFIVREGRRRLRSKAISLIFQGLPSSMIYVGVLSLAIYALVGHTVVL